MAPAAHVRRGARFVVMLAALIVGAAMVAWWTARPVPTARSTSRFPSSHARHGVDVSHHNGRIDWPQVADAGISFAWVKASEGVDLVDRRFAENASGAQRAGLRVGAYHFFSFCRPGAAQALNYVLAVGDAGLDLPPALDVEFVGNCRAAPSAEVIRREVEHWLSLVEPKLGRAVIYTTADADAALLVGLERDRWIRSIAAPPGTPWRFWQFDPSGQVPGIDGPVDLDVER